MTGPGLFMCEDIYNNPRRLVQSVIWATALWVAALVKAGAEPTISVQPRDVAVLRGQKAKFEVTASGASPLSYQWRLNMVKVPEATNSDWEVDSVTVDRLGQYEVIIGDSTGSVTSKPVWLLLARWTNLVTFGRSDSQSACASSGSWPDYLAKSLAIPLRKFAALNVSGLPSAAVGSDITRYLSSNKPTEHTLIGLWNGGCDLPRGLSAAEASSTQLGLIRRLVEAGARHIVIPRLWPPEMLAGWRESFPFLTSEVALEYDDLVDEGLVALGVERGVSFYRPDMFRSLSAIGENLAAYGFREPLGSDFSCDGLHFTSPVHRLNAEEMHHSLSPSLQFESIEGTAGGELVFKWHGGVPPFQLERTTDLRRWTPYGEPTTLSTAMRQLQTPQEFWRVLPLGR